MSGPPPRGALWDAAALPSSAAVGRAGAVTAAAAVVGALVGLAAGWRWALSIAVGAAVVLFVLWVSARVLIAGVRRSSPVVALGLAVGLYLVAVVGLFVLAVQVRPGPGGGGAIRAPGVAGGALGVVVVWTTALVAVHVRHDRPRRRDGGQPPAPRD